MTRNERIELARESKDPRVLDRLSGDEDYLVRQLVALNPSTPVEILDRLSRDEDYTIRTGVAHNPITPIEILTRLSRDESYPVRDTVSENPKWQAIEESGLLDVAILASKWLKIL